MVGLAVIAVAAISVGATLLVTRGGSAKDSAATAPATPAPGAGKASAFASANDTGPVTVITEDPTCAPWKPIQNTLADAEKNGWDQRDPSIPADAWIPGVRDRYTAVGQAMRAAADQTVPLVKMTPHRVMRELYEQFIAYARAYAERIPVYTPPDDQLALTAIAVTEALGDVCQAIEYGSAAARGPLVPPGDPPAAVAPLGDPANPKRFLTSSDPVCPDWNTALDRFVADIAAWANTDPNVARSQWSPEQKALNDAAAPMMSGYADTADRLGRRSANPTFQDFAVLDAQYRRAFVQALPTYTRADAYLTAASIQTGYVVLGACESAGVS